MSFSPGSIRRTVLTVLISRRFCWLTGLCFKWSRYEMNVYLKMHSKCRFWREICYIVIRVHMFSGSHTVPLALHEHYAWIQNWRICMHLFCCNSTPHTSPFNLCFSITDLLNNFELLLCSQLALEDIWYQHRFWNRSRLSQNIIILALYRHLRYHDFLVFTEINTMKEKSNVCVPHMKIYTLI